MAKDSSLLRQYDRIAAVVVLALLIGSLAFLVFSGLALQKEAEQYSNDLEGREPKSAQIKAVDLAADEALAARVRTPGKSELLPVRNDASAANLFTPAQRLLCVACARPIPWNAAACSYCTAKQPAEKTVDIRAVDSDGDGMPDYWEIEHKLGPKNAADADGDADKDGFTNLEEFEAKTDPNDAKSHPAYEGRMTLKAIAGTVLPIRAINKMELPRTKDADGKDVRHFQITFVSVDAEGNPGAVPLRVKDGELVGKTGFRFVRYNELPTKKITIENGQVRFINVSTLDLQRETDGKVVQIVFWDKDNPDWPGEPLFEQRATLEIDLPGVEPLEVVQGQTFAVKGETYTVKAIDADSKTVRLEKKADKKVFELK